jgi:hypothetical protein
MLRSLLAAAALVLAFTSCNSHGQITPDQIKKDVVGWKVEISGASEDLEDSEWTFDADEFKQVEILETHEVKDGVDTVIFMTTRDNPGPGEDSIEVSGKLQLHYQRQGSQWILKDIENLTFRYSVGVAI